MRKPKLNNRGFSLVELIAVIAILGVLAVIVGGSLSGVASMRAKKAARITQTMMAQCRLDNLSGRESTLRLYYDSAEEAYYAELTNNGSSYKCEKLGDAGRIGLVVSVGGTATDVASSDVTMTCSMETGTVTSFSAAAGAWDFATISVSGGHGYSVRLTRITGSAEMG